MRQTCYRREKVRVALLTICTLFAVGCTGNDGAVSARWHIVDLTLGDTYDPKSGDITDRDGACCPSMHIVNKQCDFTSPWVIRTLHVVLSNASTGEITRSDGFNCGDGEHTTTFTLPPGSWAIGLEVDAVNGNGQQVPSVVPPPEVHTIVKGDIVNLPVIEIGVHPLGTSGRLPLPPASPMVTF
jgi:hypothetical protein